MTEKKPLESLAATRTTKRHLRQRNVSGGTSQSGGKGWRRKKATAKSHPTFGKKIIAAFLAIICLNWLTVFAFYKTIASDSDEALKKTQTAFGRSTTIHPTKPLTVLLLGVDMDEETRGSSFEGGRSDSMIVATINPKTKKTTMVSLARDTYVALANADGAPTGQVEKLNHAFAYGGAQETRTTVEKMLDITIDKVVQINMDGLRSLVDTIGGITVNNTLGFPISIEETEPDFTAVIPPGRQHINGEQALVYARMRHQDPAGDFGRQERQREVVQAILKKVLSIDIASQYKQILSAVSDNIQTDIELNSKTIPELLAFSDALKHIQSLQLKGEAYDVGGSSYIVPTAQDVLAVQNDLKRSLGEKTETDLKTNIQLYEMVYGLSSSIAVINPFTGEEIPMGYSAETTDEAVYQEYDSSVSEASNTSADQAYPSMFDEW